MDADYGTVYDELTRLMKRIPKIATIASAILCCSFLVLLPVSYHLSLCDLSKSNGVSPHDSIRVTSYSRCGISDAGIWFFSFACPYTGGTRHIGDEHGIFYEGGHARVVRDRSWFVGDFGFLEESFIGEKNEIVGRDRSADFPGIYYRRFVWGKQGLPWWTLRVSFLYPILLFGILPLFQIFRHRQSLSRKTMPNEPPGAAAGSRVSLAFGRPQPRATETERYAN